MKRPVCKTTLTRYPGSESPGGYTLVEILVATALMLTIMLAVAWVFGMVGETIADSRSSLEMTSQLRSASARMIADLNGVTVTMLPPRDPASNEGYLEITEGLDGAVIRSQVFNPDTGRYQPFGIARNIDRVRVPTSAADPDQIGYEVDTTPGDFDDMMMFTTRGSGESFIGRIARKDLPGAIPDGVDDFDQDGNGDPYSYVFGTIQSDVAEIAYFVRGRTLYRRVLLVKPDFPQTDLELRDVGPTPLNQLSPRGFYNNDVSVRLEWRNVTLSPPTWTAALAANTLGDLTKPENRFAHHPATPAGGASGFPYHPHWWFNAAANRFDPTPWATRSSSLVGLGLPTLQECSHPDWWAGGIADVTSPLLPPYPDQPRLRAFALSGSGGRYDAWLNPHPYTQQEPYTGAVRTGTAPDFAADYPGGIAPPQYLGSRIGEDVLLTNVIGFDVKVWDPNAWVLPATDAAGTQTNLMAGSYWSLPEFGDDGVIPGAAAVVPGDPGYELALAHAIHAIQTVPRDPLLDRFRPVGQGAYVDLNYAISVRINGSLGYPAVSDLNTWLRNLSPFAGSGNRGLRVYDTWSTHFESNWFDTNLNGVKDAFDLGDENGNGVFDEGSDGMDNNNNGLVDEAGPPGTGEQEALAPYLAPLRGIQIKIRVFDPDSRQVRERTIVHDFLPK